MTKDSFVSDDYGSQASQASSIDLYIMDDNTKSLAKKHFWELSEDHSHVVEK